MADILDLLSGAEPTADEQTQALVAALRRQRAAGQLGMLTGDRVLSPFGQSMIHQADAGQSDIARQANDAGDSRARVLQMAMAAQERAKTAEATAAERKIDNERAERGQGLQMQSLANQGALLRLALGKDERAEEKLAKGKDLPTSAIMEMADLPVAKKAIQDLGDMYGQLDMGAASAKVSNVLPDAMGRALGTDVSKFNDAALLSMQAVGKIMEGGKLAAGDEAKYRSMLPKPGDAPDNAQRKVAQAQAFLQSLYDGRIKALGGSGYNVSGLASEAPAANPSGTPDIPAVVQMKFPDGSVHPVPAAKVDAARRKGGVEVE